MDFIITHPITIFTTVLVSPILLHVMKRQKVARCFRASETYLTEKFLITTAIHLTLCYKTESHGDIVSAAGLSFLTILNCFNY